MLPVIVQWYTRIYIVMVLRVVLLNVPRLNILPQTAIIAIQLVYYVLMVCLNY